MQLSPKGQFLLSQDRTIRLREITRSDEFHLFLTFALAEVSSRSGLTEQELSGCRKLIDCLLDLPEDPQKPSTFPTKNLNHQIDPVPRRSLHDPSSKPKP